MNEKSQIKKKIVPLEVYILYSTEGYLKTAELRYK